MLSKSMYAMMNSFKSTCSVIWDQMSDLIYFLTL
jgi:hypothetical protein